MIYDSAFLLGGVGSVCLDALTSLHNRWVPASHRMTLGLLRAMGIAGMSILAFYFMAAGSSAAFQAVLNALIPDAQYSAIRHVIELTMLVALCITGHALVFVWQLQLRFRVALGLSLVYLAAMVPAVCLFTNFRGRAIF